MAVSCHSEEHKTPIAPARLFKALFLESHVYIPKIVPQGVKSIEFIQGDGGVGSIRKINFAEGAHLKCLKHRIDALDTEKRVCKYTLLEADTILDKLDSVVYEVKFDASGDGGCVFKITVEYHAKPGCEIKEEDIKQEKEKGLGLYKAVEEYLLANPDCCA